MINPLFLASSIVGLNCQVETSQSQSSQEPKSSKSSPKENQTFSYEGSASPKLLWTYLALRWQGVQNSQLSQKDTTILTETSIAYYLRVHQQDFPQIAKFYFNQSKPKQKKAKDNTTENFYAKDSNAKIVQGNLLLAEGVTRAQAMEEAWQALTAGIKESLNKSPKPEQSIQNLTLILSPGINDYLHTLFPELKDNIIETKNLRSFFITCLYWDASQDPQAIKTLNNFLNSPSATESKKLLPQLIKKFPKDFQKKLQEHLDMPSKPGSP